MAQMTREKTRRNFFERSNAKIPDFPRMKFTPLAKSILRNLIKFPAQTDLKKADLEKPRT